MNKNVKLNPYKFWIYTFLIMFNSKKIKRFWVKVKVKWRVAKYGNPYSEFVLCI